MADFLPFVVGAWDAEEYQPEVWARGASPELGSSCRFWRDSYTASEGSVRWLARHRALIQLDDQVRLLCTISPTGVTWETDTSLVTRRGRIDLVGRLEGVPKG